MYPNITIPEPEAFFFYRWSSDPLYRGSYSNWPASFFQEHHDNLRATVDGRLWFSGEHCSQKYYVRCSHQYCAPRSFNDPPQGFLTWRLFRGPRRRRRTLPMYKRGWVCWHSATLRRSEERQTLLRRRIRPVNTRLRPTADEWTVVIDPTSWFAEEFEPCPGR